MTTYSEARPMNSHISTSGIAALPLALAEILQPIAQAVGGALMPLVNGVVNVFRAIAVAHRKNVTRHELARLDDRLLRDIGVERSEIGPMVDDLVR